MACRARTPAASNPPLTNVPGPNWQSRCVCRGRVRYVTGGRFNVSYADPKAPGMIWSGIIASKEPVHAHTTPLAAARVNGGYETGVHGMRTTRTTGTPRKRTPASDAMLGFASVLWWVCGRTGVRGVRQRRHLCWVCTRRLCCNECANHDTCRAWDWNGRWCWLSENVTASTTRQTRCTPHVHERGHFLDGVGRATPTEGPRWVWVWPRKAKPGARGRHCALLLQLLTVPERVRAGEDGRPGTVVQPHGGGLVRV